MLGKKCCLLSKDVIEEKKKKDQKINGEMTSKFWGQDCHPRNAVDFFNKENIDFKVKFEIGVLEKYS